MTKKEELTEVDPSEDTACPEGTKRYLLEKGYKPYRKESGKISWINDSNRIYKSIKKPHKRGLYYTNRFGQRKLRKWVKILIYLAACLLLISLLLYGFFPS